MNLFKSAIALAVPLLMAATTAFAEPAWHSERISVTVEGEGRDVILIPGLSSSAQVWDTTVAAVPGYRYHRIQVGGFAGAPVGSNAEGPVVAPVAEDIARYIREAGLKDTALVGHSLGGTLAMMVAARHPENVSDVMVVDMLPFMGAMFAGPGATPASVEPVAAQIRDGIANSPADQRLAMTQGTIAGMIRTESLREAEVRHALDSDPKVSGQAMYDLITTDLIPELANIKVQMRVLWVLPPNAPVTAEQMAGFYQMSFATAPNVSIRQVTDSYHFIMFDQPAVFADELRNFLK
jgi:pimeloyl-ACP methyl ester carboxylesterase